MPAHKKEFDACCTECKGTGLYVGFAEKDGIAVVCRRCKGTGAVHRVITWDDTPCTPILRPDVSWVIEKNPGIGTGVGPEFPPGSFGGMSYESWRAGNIFVRGMEMRQYVCPGWWYRNIKWKRCEWGSYPGCSKFSDKAACWERYDKEEAKP